MKTLHPREKYARLMRFGKMSKGRKAVVAEDDIQGLVEGYLKALHIPFLRIDKIIYKTLFGSDRKMNGPELGALKKAADKIKGFPDLLIMENGRYLAIELKTEIGKMSPEQKDWKEKIGTVLRRSFESARKEIDEWRAAA